MVLGVASAAQGSGAFDEPQLVEPAHPLLGGVGSCAARLICTRAVGHTQGRNQAWQSCVRWVMKQGHHQVPPQRPGGDGRHVRRRVTRASEIAVVMAAALVLAACGSAAGSDPGRSRPASAASSPLCGSVPTLSRLVVDRSDAFPQNHMRFSFPAEVTVADATKVRAAARALCALPKMPSGTLHCPADLGIVYHLVFSAGERALPPVEVDATGCQTVRGLGHVRWVARSPRFWAALGRAMGLSSPSSAAFGGRGPNG